MAIYLEEKTMDRLYNFKRILSVLFITSFLVHVTYGMQPGQAHGQPDSEVIESQNNQEIATTEVLVNNVAVPLGMAWLSGSISSRPIEKLPISWGDIAGCGLLFAAMRLQDTSGKVIGVELGRKLAVDTMRNYVVGSLGLAWPAIIKNSGFLFTVSKMTFDMYVMPMVIVSPIKIFVDTIIENLQKPEEQEEVSTQQA